MTGLVVPIDVIAYCVGSQDAHEVTGAFAGATTDYTAQASAGNGAFIGANVTRDPHTYEPLWPLEAGVHLHWAAPDGLTHAPSAGDGLTFPALPNRWLVSRVLVDGTTATGKSWILESDTLSPSSPGDANVPSLPVQDTAQNFRYLGVWEVFDGSWQEPVIPSNDSIQTLFGSELHAVASGDVAFAAFYPNARGVYGFWDALSDVPAGTTANLMYVVCGWYSAPGSDPLTTTSEPADLQARYGWTYTPAGTAPTYSLYSGLAQDIVWNSSTNYIKDNQPPIHLDVAVGNNPAEALAAYFRGKDHPALPLFEQLFTAFEIGLLSTLQQPQPGQYAQLQETVHEKGFTSVDGGTIYTIVAATADAAAGDDPAPNLPLPLADALNLLNRCQQQSDLAAVEVQQFQWQVFADWYRLVSVDAQHLGAAETTLSNRLAVWPTIQGNLSDAQAAVTEQLKVVEPMLGDAWVLKQIPAPRFWQPNEPVALLAGSGVATSPRHGGDGGYEEGGNLVCRLTSQLVTATTVGSATLSATGFPNALPASPNHLPYAADVAALVGEACVLDTALAAARGGGQDAALEQALIACLLAGAPPKGNAYSAVMGQLPSPVAVNWWGPTNPWLPLQMLWELDFAPLFPTAAKGATASYPPAFFTGNFTLDPDNVGVIGYTPGAGGIDVDPAKLDFDPVDGGAAKYTGTAVLSSTSADNLASLLTTYLATTPDATLQAVQTTLEQTSVVLQPMTGLGSALLTREQTLQLNIAVANSAPFTIRNQTKQVQAVVPDLSQIPPLSPLYGGSFNPIRAGFGQLALQVMDTFGEKRPVVIDNLYLSNDLTTVYRGTTEPGILYLQPRLAQAARVLFRWLSADTLGYDELNAHPATSPICGWLLPNHLEQGIFFYDQLGTPIGSLTVNEDATGVDWQAAPGNQATIDDNASTATADVNAQLRDVTLMLAGASVSVFQAFYAALDTGASSVAPPTDTGAGTAALLGRPVALVQASLLLELQGIGAYDETWNTLAGGQFASTDDGTSGVGFPAVLGDIDQLDDGLIGYFKGTSDGYDLSTFYSEAADPQATAGVVVPATTNLLLTPSSTTEGDPPSVTAGEHKLLMLMDPRAGIHLTTGLLPTQYLEIPPAHYADTLSALEATFLTAPVLAPAAGLALPLATETGFTWSWIEEQVANGDRWAVVPDIGPAAADAVWAYTPQQLTEGWLRLSPELLTFRLSNAGGGASVRPGSPNTLTLTITNQRRSDVTFTPGTLAPEGSTPTGSVFYVHFGALVAQGDVAAIQPSAPGWRFQAQQDAQYGAYWAATPTAAVPLAAEASLTITLADVVPAAAGTQAQVYFDYYAVQGLNDGVDLAIVAVAASTGAGVPTRS